MTLAAFDIASSAAPPPSSPASAPPDRAFTVGNFSFTILDNAPLPGDIAPLFLAPEKTPLRDALDQALLTRWDGIRSFKTQKSQAGAAVASLELHGISTVQGADKGTLLEIVRECAKTASRPARAASASTACRCSGWT